MEFDIQRFLSEMRKEQQDSHRELADKIDEVKEAQADQNTRLVVVENTRVNVKWITSAIIVALISVAIDLLRHR